MLEWIYEGQTRTPAKDALFTKIEMRSFESAPTKVEIEIDETRHAVCVIFRATGAQERARDLMTFMLHEQLEATTALLANGTQLISRDESDEEGDSWTKIQLDPVDRPHHVALILAGYFGRTLRDALS